MVRRFSLALGADLSDPLSCMKTNNETTDLGLAMLIAESEDGQYEPVAVVANLGEAREIAQDDFRRRTQRLESGESPLCPHTYRIWARGTDGEHRVAGEITDFVCAK